eukprot:113313-Heterocapsa_arctica.AAC.1
MGAAARPSRPGRGRPSGRRRRAGRPPRRATYYYLLLLLLDLASFYNCSLIALRPPKAIFEGSR